MKTPKNISYLFYKTSLLFDKHKREEYKYIKEFAKILNIDYKNKTTEEIRAITGYVLRSTYETIDKSKIFKIEDVNEWMRKTDFEWIKI